MSLNTMFYADPMGFASHYSLEPAHAVSKVFDRMGAWGSPWKSTALEGNFKNWSHREMQGNYRKALVQIEMTSTRSDNTAAVNATTYPVMGRGQGLPVWFLPWDSSGAVVELTIPLHNTAFRDYASPKFFFTAALSGCSVYVKGEPDNPTVYHCGTGLTAPTNSPEFYKRMVMTCKNLGIGTKARGRVQGIGKNAYLDRFSGPQGREDRLLAQNQLENDVGGMIIATSYTRWGAVFGFRTGMNWEFYLQRNILVKYETYDEIVERSRGFLGTGLFSKTRRRTVINRELKKCYPTSVEKIYPGSGNVEMVLDNVVLKI